MNYLPQRLTIDLDECEKYGPLSAMFLARLRYWVSFNESKGRNFVDGRTWSYSTLDEIGAALRLTRNQVRHTIKILTEHKVIRTGHFGGDQRVTWYALEEGVKFHTVEQRCEISHQLEGNGVKFHTPFLIQDRKEDNIVTTDPARSGLTVLAGGQETSASISRAFDVREEDNVADDTKGRLEAFGAVKGVKVGGVAGPGAPEGRGGDVGRRNARDARAANGPRGGRNGAANRRDGRGPVSGRPPLSVPVFEAWRDAMNKAGLPTVQIAERDDQVDADSIVQKAGGPEQAIRYVVWTVENRAAMFRQFPGLAEKPLTFRTIAGPWMRSLFPAAVKAMSAGPSPESKPKPKVESNLDRFLALTLEERAAVDLSTWEITKDSEWWQLDSLQKTARKKLANACSPSKEVV